MTLHPLGKKWSGFTLSSLVTAIIPAYNNADTVQVAIDSVLKQSYNNLEVVIVDDGSTDNTGALLDELASKESRLKIVHQKNAGPAAARNRGLAEADGDYLIFVDADDYMIGNSIGPMVELMESEGLDLVISGMKWTRIDDRGHHSVSETIDELQRLHGPTDIKAHFFDYLHANLILNSMCAKLYKREIIREHDITVNSKLDMGEDFQFNLSYIRYARLVDTYVASVYSYEMYRSTLTNRYREHLFEERKLSTTLLREFLEENQLSTQITKFLYMKLFVSQMMQDAEHRVPKATRLAHVSDIYGSEEMQFALQDFHPQGRSQKIIYRVVRDGRYGRIWLFAKTANFVRKHFADKFHMVSI